MANKLVTVEQLDAAVDGFAAEIKAQDFEKAANLKSLAYADAVSSTHMASSLTTILAGKLSNADAANLVAGEVGMTYRPGGSYEFANLPAPSATTYGMVYNVVDDFVTDTRFAEGEGKSYKSGCEVGVVLAEKADPADPDVYVYNVFSGFVDVSKFASQSSFTTFKTALDDLEVASSTDIQSLIDGLSLEDAPAPVVLAPGTYDENDNLLKSWAQLVSDGDVYINPMAQLNIPSSKKSMFDNTNVDAAKKIVIDQSVIEINNNGFYNCTSLTEIIIPNSVTRIRPNAFEGCTSLTEITIPNSVLEIDDAAFDGCTSLAEITIPNSVTYIANFAFNNCTALTTIYYNGTLTDEQVKAGSNATVVRS